MFDTLSKDFPKLNSEVRGNTTIVVFWGKDEIYSFCQSDVLAGKMATHLINIGKIIGQIDPQKIVSLEPGYYWARHNGSSSESIAQNTTWRPVEVAIGRNKKLIVWELACGGPFNLEDYEFGDKIEASK